MKKLPNKSFIAVLSLMSVLCVSSAYAAGDISSVTTTLRTQLIAVSKLLSLASYVAGIGLTIGALMKFKAHKDNPTQEPLGKAITMLVVAGSLMFLPTVMQVASNSIFGSASGGSATSFDPGA